MMLAYTFLLTLVAACAVWALLRSLANGKKPRSKTGCARAVSISDRRLA
jgi:hypothetical protein